MKELLIYFLTFAAVVVPSVFFLLWQPEKNQEKDSNAKEDKIQIPLILRFLTPMAKMFDSMGTGNLFRSILSSREKSLEHKIRMARLPFTTGFIYCAQLSMMIIATVPVVIITSLIVEPDERLTIPIAGLIAILVGWSLPAVTIGNLEQKYKSEILQAIPYSIDLVASAMRGGLDFTAAIRYYVNLGVSGPLSSEYAQMLREMELGVIRTTALENMAERIGIKEFTNFASAIVIGSELGASLTETMEIQGEEMRKARFALAEYKAQKAPSLMLLPMALFIMPAVFIIILTPVFLKMQDSGVSLF